MTATQTPPASRINPLPAPAEHPSRDVVIYDGHCKFCTSGVGWVAWLGGRSRLTFVSLHDPQVADLVPELTHDDLMREMVVVDRRGKRYAGASAFRYLTRKLPLLWPLAPFLHIPGSLPLWQWAYLRFARIRYRFGKNQCDGDTCKIHFG